MKNEIRVTVADGFWRPRIDLFAKEVIPYQWRLLNDREPDAAASHAVENFRIAAGLAQGEHYGKVFQDSDVAKWIEAASFSLKYLNDENLKRDLSELIGVLEKAQGPDGYLNTYYTVKEPEKRWTNVENGHELYCAGHMLEAAVAYAQATGDARLLAIMSRYTDYILSVFGKEKGKLDSYPGHPEIELALIKAYDYTGDEKYLRLSSYFINNRGAVSGFLNEPLYLERAEKQPFRRADYYQAHAPIRLQKSAEGHSVRAMYLYSGAADVAAREGDETLKAALEELWENTVQRRMYVTGGVGSEREGERFSIDYDLPSDRAYTETCAAVGMAMWAYRMLGLSPQSKYADVMERVLYNGMLSGVSFDGRRYFYVNPLAVKPEVASYRQDHRHVKTRRVKWFGTACCPPNAVRTVLSIGNYMYTRASDDVYMHLYIGGDAQLETAGGALSLHVDTKMPWAGEAQVRVSGASGASARLWLRVPAYAGSFALLLNGRECAYEVKDGYASFNRPLADGDIVRVGFGLYPQFVYANPNAAELSGRAAVMRGPFVYCAEEADNFPLLDGFQADCARGIEEEQSDLFGGIIALSVKGTLPDAQAWGGSLYGAAMPARKDAVLRLIPYALWNNRAPGGMRVWLLYR